VNRMMAVVLCIALLAVSACASDLVAGPVLLADVGTLPESLQPAAKSAIDEFHRHNLKDDDYQIRIYETASLYQFTFSPYPLGFGGFVVKVDKVSNSVVDSSFYK
jgi:hypothetical protein